MSNPCLKCTLSKAVCPECGHDPEGEVNWEALMAEEARRFALDQAGELDALFWPPLGYPEPPDDPPDEPDDGPCGDCPYVDRAPDSPPPHCWPECPARKAMQALYRRQARESLDPEGSVYFSIGRAPYDL